MPIDEVQTVIRDVPKPVVAKVRGYAIGGGNVLATICDLTLAADTAIFGQVGPKMGSVDPGFGTDRDMLALMEEAHGMDMRVIVDGVFNHTGDEHWAFESFHGVSPFSVRRSCRCCKTQGDAGPKDPPTLFRQILKALTGLGDFILAPGPDRCPS